YEAGLIGGNVVGSVPYLRECIVAGAVRSAIGDNNPVVGECDVRACPVRCRSDGAGYGVRRARSCNREHLYDREIVTVRCRCDVVDRHTRAAGWSGKVLALHPVGIAVWSKILMNHRLIGSERPCYRIVKVVTNPENPRIVSSGY